MFRSLGSVFCVVVMAAFVFGCGGGGGGGGTTPDPPVVVDPEPTDAERIAEARQMIATILTNARAQAARASSAASALRTNADATADQITRAASHNTDAQAALTLIENANSAAIAATTPAAAQTALDNAKTAQSTLNTADSAITSIQGIVQAVTNARMQREANELALTNGSSLIQHVRDNKLVFDAILADLKDTATDPLNVGLAGATTRANDGAETCTAPCATFAKDIGTGADRVAGMRRVTVSPLPTSGSTTPTLTGTSTLLHGFDLKNATNTTFVNAYTDITKTRVVRTQTALDDSTTTGVNEAAYENRDVGDTDYLLAGIWIQNDGGGDPAIAAFAYGSQPLTATVAECGPTELAAASNGGITRVCTQPSTVSNISDFVEDGRDVNATYSGQANGAHLAAGETSYFTGDVNLTAQFVNPTGGDGTESNGSIEGAVTNIVVGGQSIDGSIELQQHTFANAIGALFNGDAVGVVEGNAYGGSWKGQFFGQEFRRSETTGNVTGNTPERTTTVTYKAQAPGSVAGNFYVVKDSTPGDEAFIGAFGAHR